MEASLYDELLAARAELAVLRPIAQAVAAIRGLEPIHLDVWAETIKKEEGHANELVLFLQEAASLMRQARAWRDRKEEQA